MPELPGYFDEEHRGSFQESETELDTMFNAFSNPYYKIYNYDGVRMDYFDVLSLKLAK